MAFQYDAQHKKHNIIFILESNFHAIKNNCGYKDNTFFDIKK